MILCLIWLYRDDQWDVNVQDGVPLELSVSMVHCSLSCDENCYNASSISDVMKQMNIERTRQVGSRFNEDIVEQDG